jgi:hypothetical protein
MAAIVINPNDLCTSMQIRLKCTGRTVKLSVPKKVVRPRISTNASISNKFIV